MRKRLLALACVFGFTFSLTACGSSENNENTQEIASATVTEQSTEHQTEEQILKPTETSAPTEIATPEETDAPTQEPTEEPMETEIPVHEHGYSSIVTVRATCSNSGRKLYTCECGSSYEEVYWGEHMSDGNVVVNNAPTCISEGTSVEYCVHCGAQMNAKSIPKSDHVPANYWIYRTDLGEYRNGCAFCGVLLQTTTVRPEGVEIKDLTPIDSNTLQPIQ